MWFNSKQREEPYLGLTCWCKPVETSAPLRSASTGAAWLSSARVVRCWVKSRNERNPRSQLPAVRPGTLGGLPALSRRKVGTTSSHHGPRSEEHTSELQSQSNLVCRLLLEKKKKNKHTDPHAPPTPQHPTH